MDGRPPLKNIGEAFVWRAGVRRTPCVYLRAERGARQSNAAADLHSGLAPIRPPLNIGEAFVWRAGVRRIPCVYQREERGACQSNGSGTGDAAADLHSPPLTFIRFWRDLGMY